MEKSDNQWRSVTRQLLIRAAECILENRFPEMKTESMQTFENPLNFPFNKQFSGKFGLNKDLENFPDFNKTDTPNNLTISFFLKSLTGNVSPRRNSNSTSTNLAVKHKE